MLLDYEKSILIAIFAFKIAVSRIKCGYELSLKLMFDIKERPPEVASKKSCKFRCVSAHGCV